MTHHSHHTSPTSRIIHITPLGATCGDVGMSLFVAGASFGDVGVSLFAAAFDVGMSLFVAECHFSWQNVTFRGRRTFGDVGASLFVAGAACEVAV